MSKDHTRLCPRCETKLTQVDLELQGRFLVERCAECFGLFFDQGELNSLILSSAKVEQPPSKLAELLQQDPPRKEWGGGYLRCPVCTNLMNRENYQDDSGVIADICPMHGLWLDGGELSAVLRWGQQQRPASGTVHRFEEVVETQDGKRTVKTQVRLLSSDEVFSLDEVGSKSEFGQEVDELFSEVLARMFGDLL